MASSRVTLGTRGTPTPTTLPSPQSLSMTSLVAGGVGVAVAGLYLYLRSKSDDVPADIATIVRLLSLKRHLMAMNALEHWSVADMFEAAVKAQPDKEALVYMDTVANWAIAAGIRPGSVVALVMDNRPEYIFTWLGLAKAGAIIALINTNLVGRPLVHSLTVCKARHFIVGDEHTEHAAAAKEALGYGIWYSYGGKACPGYNHLDELISTQPTTPTTVSRTTKPTDVLFYIYTSGTTGAPKASIIKHIRFYIAGSGFARIYGVHEGDRIYCALPLYHSAGGMIGVGLSWYTGGTLVFRKKFSASRFWEDVRATNCTVIQYIGELCRFLLATPESPLDGKSKVRLAIGNGLRKDVWIPFQKRFKIPDIGEFYAATEGNASLFNYRNRAGAVGYIPPLIGRLYPVKIVKFDIETEQPVRGPDGFCITCAPDEPGELIGKIESDDPSRVFDGYTDQKATEKKILHNVYEKGDQWFRTGDLLRKDKSGYFYFVDRIGDTFRWKGENVATSEIELVIASVPGVKDVNVYGVQVPGHDGRAGMASLTVEPTFSLEELYSRIRAELPTYAQPLFVRFQPEMDLTGTFKHKKFDLQAQGFNPDLIKEPLFFRDDVAGKFIAVTPAIYQQLTQGVGPYAKL